MTKIRTKTGSLAFARYQLNRAILENVLEQDFTKDDQEAALEFFGGCAYCGTKKARRNDHLVPVVDRGDFVRQNVVPACGRCDDSKGQRDFRSWMRESTSECSLHRRGLTDAQIEQRIKRIDEWQCGYKSRSEEQLFGKHFDRYQLILEKMNNLISEAQQLIDLVNHANSDDAMVNGRMPVSRKGDGSANIRQFVLETHIMSARLQGKKRIRIRAGDVHKDMGLHQQYRNVCQTLKGKKLQEMANIKLVSIKGPREGSNVYFTYQI